MVNQLLSSESKSNGIPIEFEIVSQPRLKKENYENQLVTQPIKKISWYPNRKKRTIPTNKENQLVAQRIKKISWYPNRKKRTIQRIKKTAGSPTNKENQPVPQPIKKISWYPNRKKRTIKAYIALISKRKTVMVHHAQCKKKNGPKI